MMMIWLRYEPGVSGISLLSVMITPASSFIMQSDVMLHDVKTTIIMNSNRVFIAQMCEIYCTVFIFHTLLT
jgi:hypothetical protein